MSAVHHHGMNIAELILIAEARQAAKSGRGRRLRQLAGLSQLEISAAVGVSQAAVTKWENGLRSPHGTGAVNWALLLRELAGFITSPPTQEKEVNS